MESPILWILALLLAAVGVLTLWWANRARRGAGLPTGKVIYADTSQWQRAEAPIISRRWGLVGRPDYLVSHGDKTIPVEVKSGRRPAHPYPSHILQLAAYCLLVEERTGRRPSHGLLHYDDATVQIAFDNDLRRTLITMLTEMQRAAGRSDVPRSHDDPARCRGCGVRHACGESYKL